MSSKIEVRIENSESRTKKHRKISAAFIVENNSVNKVLTLLNSQQCKGTYAKGKCLHGYVSIDKGQYVVLVELTMNWRKHIKGYIRVLDHNGVQVLIMKYVNGKIRYVKGEKSLIGLIKLPIDITLGELYGKK